MKFLNAYLICAAGVVLSAIIPSLAKTVRQYFGTGGPANLAESSFVRMLWDKTKPYAILGVFSLAVAVLIVAFLGDRISTWQSALIAGYVWDSTLQKIAKG